MLSCYKWSLAKENISVFYVREQCKSVNIFFSNFNILGRLNLLYIVGSLVQRHSVNQLIFFLSR